MSQRSKPAALADFTRFAAVGGIGFVVDGGILTLMMSRGQGALASRFVSFGVAVTMTWVLNRAWTFSRTRRTNRGHEYVAYLVTQGVGAALNLGVFFTLLWVYPALRQHPLVPLAAGALVALIFNFIVSKTLVYHSGDQAPQR